MPLATGLAANWPIGGLLERFKRENAAAGHRLATVVAQDAAMRRLLTAPGVGPVTAAAYVATLEDLHRFGSAREVAGDRGARSPGVSHASGRGSQVGCLDAGPGARGPSVPVLAHHRPPARWAWRRAESARADAFACGAERG